jgi:hypothetical protein
MIEGKSQDEKLGPAGFGRYLHDAFENAFSVFSNKRQFENIFSPEVLIIFTLTDALISSMLDKNPQDEQAQKMRMELDKIEEEIGQSVYDSKQTRFEQWQILIFEKRIGNILRDLGVIRSGSKENEDQKECDAMEDELNG